MSEYQDGIVGEPPKNWDDLLAHFKKVQEEMKQKDNEITFLREQEAFYKGQTHAYASALRIIAEGINGRNKD